MGSRLGNRDAVNRPLGAENSLLLCRTAVLTLNKNWASRCQTRDKRAARKLGGCKHMCVHIYIYISFYLLMDFILFVQVAFHA